MTDEPRTSRRRWLTVMAGVAAATPALLAPLPTEAAPVPEPQSIDGGSP